MRIKCDICLWLLMICVMFTGCMGEEKESQSSNTESVSIVETEDDIMSEWLKDVDKDVAWYGDGFLKCMKKTAEFNEKPKQVKAVHDWIIMNAEICNKSDDNAAFVSGADGVLVHGKATMEGYNKAFAECMKVLGVPCETVNGKLDGMDREWINVQLDGEWYHIDLVADDTYRKAGDSISYNYFNVTDEEMKQEYSWDSLHKCDSVTYSYYDYYYAGEKILDHQQLVNYIESKRNSKEIMVVVKNNSVTQDNLRDYESVSEKCGELVSWRVSKIISRGSFTVYRLYMNTLVKDIETTFAHSPKEFYEIMNEALKGWKYTYTIVVEDSGFNENAYNRFQQNYVSEHYGYVENYQTYKTKLTSSAYIDPDADSIVANYTMVQIDVKYFANKNFDKIAINTEQLINYVVEYYAANESKINYVTHPEIVVYYKTGSDITEDIKVIETALKKKYSDAYVVESSIREVKERKDYKVWKISMCKEEWRM